ncbi:helix-turn-helix transcriptional regulator [Streptomyces sp. NPDC060000]|uniref:helix-turn-helix transcriptional regulator n=1 Tax=Streptomyces sp. NPDC060000 TaxID=3347031 RepID=UPI00368EAA0D
MTVSEIALEHGVSRQSVHSYRTRGSFPKPVEGEGSTRPRFRSGEVAAWFAANPPQPGKRTDLASQDEGAAMPQTEQPAPISVSPPDYLSSEQWAGLSLAILQGAVEGVDRASLPGAWASDLGVAAVKGLRDRLDELMAEERDDG